MQQSALKSRPGKVAGRLPLDRQRADFLRNCRARLQPSDLGLPSPQRRRTTGLRREDVAALSGVSVAWYTWLEQGREMRVSDEVLERICLTFRLAEDERMYLFQLVQGRPPRITYEEGQALPDEVARMVAAMPWPAIVTNLRWDVLGWNRLNTQLYRDYSTMTPQQRNLIQILFRNPPYQVDEAAAESFLRRILAKLRVDYGAFGDDPKFQAMIEDLEENSPMFRRLWRSPDIHVGSIGLNRFRHARFGELAFEHVSCVPDGHPTLRIVMCRPHDERSRQVIDELNSEIRATRQ